MHEDDRDGQVNEEPEIRGLANKKHLAIVWICHKIRCPADKPKRTQTKGRSSANIGSSREPTSERSGLRHAVESRLLVGNAGRHVAWQTTCTTTPRRYMAPSSLLQPLVKLLSRAGISVHSTSALDRTLRMVPLSMFRVLFCSPAPDTANKQLDYLNLRCTLLIGCRNSNTRIASILRIWFPRDVD